LRGIEGDTIPDQPRAPGGSAHRRGRGSGGDRRRRGPCGSRAWGTGPAMRIPEPFLGSDPTPQPTPQPTCPLIKIHPGRQAAHFFGPPGVAFYSGSGRHFSGQVSVPKKISPGNPLPPQARADKLFSFCVKCGLKCSKNTGNVC